ncbi:MAG: transglutaminase domain-containing protein [Acutalibacteraceae bacterium]
MKPIKRIISLFLCAAAVLTLSSCFSEKSISELKDAAQSAVESLYMPKIETPSLIKPDDNTDVGEFSSIEEINANSKNYTKLDIKAGFDSLDNEAQRSLYNRMATDVYVVGSNKSDSGLYSIEKIYIYEPITEKDIRVAMSAFKNDYPEVFWLSNRFSYISSDSAEIQLYSVIPPEEITEKSEELIAAVSFFIGKIPPQLSEFERELKIHDLLLNSCVYNDEVESTSDDWVPFSIYGALVSGSAVCEGYSKAMQYLLSVFGIECNTVCGSGNGNLHQWNTVKIDGEWYHLDATWNDTTDNRIFYDYFNVSDEVILYDHSIAKLYTDMTSEELCGSKDDGSDSKLFNVFTPKCNSVEANFYTRNSVLYDGINDECTARIEERLIACVEGGNDTIYLMTDSTLDYNQAINTLFYEQPYQFFKCVEEVNYRLGNVIDDESVSFLKRERHSIIEVCIKLI